jgi:hypothetical protein
MPLRRIPNWIIPSVVIGAIVACLCFAGLVLIQRKSSAHRQSKLLLQGTGPLDSSKASPQQVLALPKSMRDNLVQWQDLTVRAALTDLALMRAGIDTSEERLALAINIAEPVQPTSDPNELPNLQAFNMFPALAYVWAKYGPFEQRGEELEELALRFSTSATFIERNVAARLVWAALVVPRPGRSALLQARLERTFSNLVLNPEVRAEFDLVATEFRNARDAAGNSAVLFDDVDKLIASLQPK